MLYISRFNSPKRSSAGHHPLMGSETTRASATRPPGSSPLVSRLRGLLGRLDVVDRETRATAALTAHHLVPNSPAASESPAFENYTTLLTPESDMIICDDRSLTPRGFDAAPGASMGQVLPLSNAQNPSSSQGLFQSPLSNSSVVREMQSQKELWQTMLTQQDLLQYLELPEEIRDFIEAKVQIIASNKHTSLETTLSYAKRLITEHVTSKAIPTGTVAANVPPPVQTAIPVENAESGMDWEKSIPIEYLLMLNKFGGKKEERLLRRINRVAARSPLKDAVNYAVGEIVRESGNTIPDDTSSVGTHVSELTNAPSPPANREIPTIVETVEENQDEDEHPTLPATGGGGGGDPPPPGGGSGNEENSIDSSRESSLLCDLVSQLREQNELARHDQQKNFELIEKALSKSDTYGRANNFKDMRKQKATDFPPIPVDRNEFSIPKWCDDVRTHLLHLPWAIPVNADGTNLRCILDADEIPDEILSTEEYTARISHLSSCLVGLLHQAKDLDGATEALKDVIVQHNGPLLLQSIRDFLVPPTPLDIVRTLTALFSCTQKNGESADAYLARLNNIWSRIKLLGYDSFDDLKMASLQRGFLTGAYAGHKSIEFVTDKITGRDLTLRNWSKPTEFVGYMKQQFQDRGIFSEGSMKKVTSAGIARHVNALSPSKTITDSSTMDWSSYLCNTCTEEDVLELMQHTDCPLCRLPKNHPKTHNFTVCPLKRTIGITDVTYRQECDKRRADYDKKQEQQRRRKKKDEEDERRFKKKGKNPEEKDPDTNKQPTPKDTKSEDVDDDGFTKVESPSNKKKKPDDKKNDGPPLNEDGTVKTIGQRNEQSRRMKAWSETKQGFVDASQVDNDLNNPSEDYFNATLNSILGAYDRIDSSKITPQIKARCVALCKRHFIRRTESPNELMRKIRKLVLDSGATADMRKYKDDFEIDSYVRCHNAFVCMGNGMEIPIAGYGTSRAKINGNVVRLPLSLHVPDLDCDLLSATRHGRKGAGHTFLISDGKYVLTFPDFIVSNPIPVNDDLAIELEPMTEDDWDIPNHLCHGNTDCDVDLDDFEQRLNYIHHVFRARHSSRVMTRAQQRQENTDKLKKILGNQNKTAQKDCSSSKDLNEQETMQDLDPRFIAEGKIDREMISHLQKLVDADPTLSDLDEDPVDKPTAFQKDDRAPPPQYYLESSRGNAKHRVTSHQLRNQFGGRKIHDFALLSKLGTGISVIEEGTDILTVGELVNRKRGRRKRKGSRAAVPLEVVGCDIGFGDGVAVGGAKYVLLLVDQCTTQSFVYGMHGCAGSDICEALWKFFIDAGGFPKTLQCDFDPKFIGGKAASLLRSHGTHVRAAPPHRQDKNGLVERKWQSLVEMARSFLTEARLPKKFWFWAIREASLRHNILPVTQDPSKPDDVKFWTTPFAEFYGTKPDYRILFNFGSIGAFRRVTDGSIKRSKMDAQSMLGIALGRSEFTNGMVFYNPEMDSFCVSADYILDSERHIGDIFPSLRYDGGFVAKFISEDKDKNPSTYGIGDTVFVQCQETYDILQGKVQTPPTSVTNMYTIDLDDSDESINVKPEFVFDEYNVPSTGQPTDTLQFFRPDWLKRDEKVTILDGTNYLHGFLSLSKDNLWEFVTRDKEGRVVTTIPIHDIQYSWKMRMQENTFDIGWSYDKARRTFGSVRHVSAANLNQTLAPANLRIALASNNPDRLIWSDAYDEEYDNLNNLETFDEITTEEYYRYLKHYGDDARAIPSMNIFTVKKDKEGNPLRAKSRIVVLGNLEQRIWSKSDKYAPVLSGSAARLLLSMAVEDGRSLKQGDCKNAFVQSKLKDDEIYIVKPPLNCPRSKRGTYWKLNKSLYGLARSPYHWYNKITGHLKKDLGFMAMDQDKCVYKCQPFPDKPPIYLGLYVDDFIYYLKSDDVEQWFKNKLKSMISVDFMGKVQWFLGQRYEWNRDPVDGISCHVSQQAFVEGVLQNLNLSHIKTANSPYQSGLKIDRIKHDYQPIDSPEFVQKYQSLVGCLNWLSINTRPDINTACSLLS